MEQTELFDCQAIVPEGDAAPFVVHPLAATFRDSMLAPLHSWFPYLEGYSPAFVRAVHRTYLPDATAVLEPFAGSGTTPIVLGQAGVACDYLEANPAMALVSRVKLAALASEIHREGLARELRLSADQLDETIRRAKPNAELQASYKSAFGESAFFAEDVFDSVLRLRTICDEHSRSGSSIGADALTVAVLANLIPCSLLKRAGDLRYKTVKELSAPAQQLDHMVAQTLRRMAADIASTQAVLAPACMIGSDARELFRMPVGKRFDGVITSPPYLNGTNYIRNARLELWFLRVVAEKSDLRNLRDTVVTSGINDVDAKTKKAPDLAKLKAVLKELALHAYDDRIARMVGGYFADMKAVVEGIAKHVKPRGRVCIDIGDSVYAGVRVPTHELLVDIADQAGYMHKETVHLRKRRSKGGDELSQSLLVLEAPPARRERRRPQQARRSNAGWAAFRDCLPHQRGEFAKRNWGSPLHSLCSYQGKLKPSLAFHLVEAFSRPGDVVVDPFSGAGTVPFEACRNGRVGIGIDISRLGYVLTRAKVRPPAESRVRTLIKELDSEIRNGDVSREELASAAAVRFNSAIPDYFHEDSLREILIARRFLNSRWAHSDEWALIFACCLHILHGNRPYAMSRRSHPITPFAPTGAFEYRALIPRLIDKIERALGGWTPDFRPGQSIHGDCAEQWQLPRKADVVITSPPFFDSTKFYMTNWMRYWFAGWERCDFEKSVGDFFETRQRNSLDVYEAFFARAAGAMAEGATMVMHLGYSKKCDMAREIASRAPRSFSLVDTFYEDVDHCESHGMRDKGAVTGHSYLVLRRS